MSKSKGKAEPKIGVNYSVRVQISITSGSVSEVLYIPFEYDVDSIGYSRTMLHFLHFAVSKRKDIPYMDFVDAMRSYLEETIFPGEV